MNITRYERLIEIFKSGSHQVDLRNLQVISNIAQTSKNKKPVIMIPSVTTKNRLRVRISYKGKRYEYELHEIISVWLRKYIVDMNCIFLDGNPHNCHPSNLYWTDKNGGQRPDLMGEKHGNSKLTKQQVEEIRKIEFSKNRWVESPIDKTAKKYGISRYTIIGIRSTRNWKKLKKNSF